MRIARKLLLTPVGISLAVVHWIVVTFAMLGDSSEPGFGQSTYLMLYLYWLNLPALMVTSFISRPLVYLFGLDALSGWLFSTVAIICVTLQWLVYGKLIQFVIDNCARTHRRSKEEALT